MDTFDSVGIMDSYFPEADFFKEFERFERNVQLRSQNGNNLDYVSICSPNYLHDSHIRFALNNGIDAISEKPLVLNPWTLDALVEQEKVTGRNVYNILQLRVHPSIIALRNKILNGPKDKVYDVDLTYLTSRGTWYYTTWKADESKSGGIATNIGVHFFDMLSWIFGDVKINESHIYELDKAAGYLEFERARVRWFLSINPDMLPDNAIKNGQRTYRSITIDGEELEFSGGFTDLHSMVYQDILAGKGYRVSDAKSAIEIVFALRHMTPKGKTQNSHEYCNKAIKSPFLSFSKGLERKYIKKLCGEN
jgi:UDP-N-acetyl-2-amino-2-deoxyglucuronate dehydrogenase